MNNEQWVFRSTLSGRTDIIEITLRVCFRLPEKLSKRYLKQNRQA